MVYDTMFVEKTFQEPTASNLDKVDEVFELGQMQEIREKEKKSKQLEFEILDKVNDDSQDGQIVMKN